MQELWVFDHLQLVVFVLLDDVIRGAIDPVLRASLEVTGELIVFEFSYQLLVQNDQVVLAQLVQPRLKRLPVTLVEIHEGPEEVPRSS